MYTLNLILKNCPSAISLSFKAFKKADDARKKAHAALFEGDKLLEMTDDYEQIVAVDMGCVSGVVMGDIEKDLDRQGEVGILQHKSQLRSQVNANNDKGLAMLTDAARPPQANPNHPAIIKGN